MKKDEKRLVLDVPEDLHNQIKQIAAKHGCSMKVWIVRAIVDQMIKEGYVQIGEHYE